MDNSPRSQPGAATAHWPGRYQRVLGHGRHEWPTLLGVLLATLASSALAALQPWPLKILVDSAIQGAPLPALLASWFELTGLTPGNALLVWFAALASILIFVVQSGLDAGLTMGWAMAGQRVVYSLATELLLHLQRLSLLFHARQPVGDSIERITTDSWCVYAVAENLLIAPLKYLVLMATTGLIAWQLDPGLTLVLLVATPVLAASAAFFSSRLKRFARAHRDARGRVAAFVQQVLGAIPLIQAFAATARNREVFTALANDTTHAVRRSSIVNSAFQMVNAVATTLAMTLVVYLGANHVLQGSLSLGSLLVFIAYARTLQSAAQGLLTSFGKLRSADASVDRVLEILQTDDAVRDRPGARELPPRQAQRSGHLEFRAVRFGYEPGQAVLDGIDLDVAAGETIALVGSTGAGKSTLAALIPRFYDPWSGAVMLDGVDLRDLRLANLRGEIALVLQEPFILPLTVAENIAYGRPNASREKIIAAAVAANAHEFIWQLPDTYETVLGEQGADLSGGQRQRIGIARAFLRDARLLVMDEPTAALDANTEQIVMQAARRLMHGRTTLVIAHRLSTIRAAHRIALLADGRIAELGTHAELLAFGGRYAQMLQLQQHGRNPDLAP